jgi:hypothetical protein
MTLVVSHHITSLAGQVAPVCGPDVGAGMGPRVQLRSLPGERDREGLLLADLPLAPALPPAGYYRVGVEVGEGGAVQVWVEGELQQELFPLQPSPPKATKANMAWGLLRRCQLPRWV